MNDLSSENREKAKSLWEKIAQIKQEYSGLNMHKMICEASKELHQILPSDPPVIQMVLVSLIKSRQFDEAIKFIEASADYKKMHEFEHAYILHRLGRNKEALDKLKSIPADERS